MKGRERKGKEWALTQKGRKYKIKIHRNEKDKKDIKRRMNRK